VTVGPYSIVRNPLYVFSILGAAGAGAQLGSITTAMLSGLLAWLVFHVVVRQEERLMAERYGDAFAAYMASVPRFLPDLRLWRDVPTLTVIPRRVVQTFADAMFLLLAVPLAELFEHLQQIGMLPVRLHLL
jgi:hypothetical protein